MAEWLKAPAWKACILLKVSRVRIPFSPPNNFFMKLGKKIKFLKTYYLNFLKNNFFLFYRFSILISGIFKFIKIKFNKKSFFKYSNNLESINYHEYKITSQNNEDGIIDFIINKICSKEINFIEIGFDFYENNSLNLFKKTNRGLLIDGSFEKCLILEKIISIFYNNKKIRTVNSLVYKENVNRLIDNYFDIENEEIDFLSIDVDGIDYYLFAELNFRPKLICIEYNHWLGSNQSVVIPYDPNFKWKRDFYSGASLLAITRLASKKKYHLVAVDTSATNAFFIRDDFKNQFEILDPILSFKKPIKYSSADYIKAEKFLENKVLLKV